MAKRQKLSSEELGFVEDENGDIKIDDIIIPSAPTPALSNDAPLKRLVITDLIVKNFKSYAGEQRFGPFNKNFTALVGPNGSGKSNVIDSLLFVFGSKANQIRSKKIRELIHRSDQYPELTSCTVTVNFATIHEEGNDYAILPNTKFTFSRTAFLDGNSYYEISNKRVSFKEVQQRLKVHGIDLDNKRFLMLQGEVELIAQMSPKAQKDHDAGLLEYLEDTIGTNRYIEPIGQFNEKVQRLNEDQKEKLNILKLVEKEKNDLEEPKNGAIDYLRLGNKLNLFENSLLHYKSVEAEKELHNAVQNKKEFMEQVNTLKKELEDLKSSKRSNDNELEKIDKEMERLQKYTEELKEKFTELERQDLTFKENIKHAKSKHEKLDSSLTTAKNELAKYVKQSAIFENETAELATMKDKLESEKQLEEEKMGEVMGSLKQELNMLQEKKDKFEKEIIKLKNVAYDMKSEMDLSQSELDIYLSAEKKEKDNLSDLMSGFQKTEESASEEEKVLKQEENLISKTEAELSVLTQQLSDSRIKENTLSQQLKSSRIKFEEARNSLHASRHRSGMMQAFLKEKSNGRLTGVYGRLGDLGAIDEKYDVAISTACGQLDNIVTDTINTAQQCVQFLKKHNLGYTTFIPLDKMTRWEQYAYTKIKTPENVPRLYDLIHVNDKSVLPAFYYALRDTLVADNLGQATRIGLQGKCRYRVVTLNGELIDLSGTMSGGGNRVQRGRMGSSIIECTLTNEDVSEIGAEVEHLVKSIANIKKSIINLEDQITKTNKELSSLTLSVKKRKCNCNAFKENVKMIEMQIKEQKKKIEVSLVDKDKVKALEQDIQEKTQNYLKASSDATAMEENISKLQEEILKISKGKFSKIKKTHDQLTKKLNEVSQTIAKSTVNIKSSKRNIKKIEDKICNIEKTIVENKELINSFKDQRNSLTAKGQEVHDKKQESEEKLVILKEKRASLKKKLESVKEKEHQIKLKEIELMNEFKKYEAFENEKRILIRSIKAKLTKLKLNAVEDDPTELPSLTVDEIKALSPRNLTSEMEIIKSKMDVMKPNISAIKEYKEKEKIYTEKKKILDDITKERDLQNMRLEELCNRRKDEFKKGFRVIAIQLKECYQMLALGGDAELDIIDSYDPFSKGIDFSVRPPNKSWKLIKNLSGGEKTLSSLALVFATHYYRPSPIYVMDEIDAALDVRNVAIVGFFLKRRTRNTQFVIVSLRNVMNELSDHMLGIFKIQNCSKHVSISHVEQWEKNVQSDS